MVSVFLLAFSFGAEAQSKTPPTNASAITGVRLPGGSKQDKRLISTSAARGMMSLVAEPLGVKLKSEEVLALPGTELTKYEADSLMDALTQSGWHVQEIPNEDDYVWLEKNGNWVLVYYKQGKKQTELYFAEASGTPSTQGGTPSTPPAPAPVIPTSTEPPAPVGNQTVQQPPPPVQQAPQQQPATPVASGYAFNTTHFDDGWTAVEESDWVRVTKGAITVLLHYDHYKVDYSSMDRETMTRNAWNVIVAPRYASLRNYYMSPSVMTSETPYYCSGTLSDAKGDHFVVLFRKGRKEWIEFITPDRSSFEREFGIREDQMAVYMDLDLWNKMKDMYGKNYFAVGPADLPGHWTTNFFGMTQYYSQYTGLNVGATSHSSVQEYIIRPDLSYDWSLNMATGWVGAQKFDSAKSKGKVSLVNNWTAHFSDIDGKPRDYAVYFTAFKGGRKLWVYGQGFLKKP